MQDKSLKADLIDQKQGYLLKPETQKDFIGIAQSGKRQWIYPRKPKGKYTFSRNLVAYTLLLFYFTFPFIKINGNPLLLFDIINRKFFLLGEPFYPHDFFILTLGAIISLISMIVFTVVFGRIFCGWICPQTIFLESIFRKIEYAIEGDRKKQMELDHERWTFEKIWKKSLKWTVFMMISLAITHFLLMYIVGYHEVLKIVWEGPLAHTSYFIAMIFSTVGFYFVFAWFREQICTLVCPYGILQSVLIDKETLNVFYDFKRGENRSKWRKGEDRNEAAKGDCIDCHQCVAVCPTGIDIRNGQQLECIHCSACIDACDEVMDKAGLPRGLIRYTSENEIITQQQAKLSTKKKSLVFTLIALQTFLGFLLYNQTDIEAKFVKQSGSTFFVRDGRITNTYNYTFLNKSDAKKIVTIKILKPKNGEILSSGSSKISVDRGKIIKGTINISFPKKDIHFFKQNISIGVFDLDGNLIDSYETYFEGPFKLLKLS